MGRWICCLCSRAADSLMLLLVLAASCNPSLEATASPSAPHVKPSYSFGRTFLGLDKCNACIGTSICKKFFKEEIRFDNWLSSHLKLPPSYLLSYSGNYTDDAKSWRLVDITRLTTKYRHDQADKRICTVLLKTRTCSLERALRRTTRVQKWLQAKRLTPDLVQGLSSPMLRCPSQRLLDRIVRRYAEVPDAGSIYMDHLTDRDKLRLLYTLSVNSHPILLQIFPDVEGWPFPRYLGACGRLVVSASTRPLRDFFGAAPEVAADLALQLLAVLRSMGTNDLNYFFYFTHVDAGTFGVFSNGHLFIRDASMLGIIDKEEGSQLTDDQQEYKDIFSCLTVDCQSAVVSCNSIREKQSLVMVCQELLPKLLKGKFLQPIQEKIDSFLQHCADDFTDDQGIDDAVAKLAELLKPLRSCDSRFAYRYPDCKYSDKY
ncbi:divergent protein kinase domain 2B [Apteryx mantelli]|uniref:Divergent protein kinase domain 2B n=1 Tax=Apteryx mantelli TaxID=2696672 RepID=A0A8B7IHK1_9AVES|nr:PREDICTED: deleted in autism-related protein 1 isoform X2 [Apteryx mantelli mantelli]XP_025931244.1 deleted in autism-related protein 1 isoform X2 [Apteryx rowi]